MACYLVTYDLNKETVRPPIVEKIKSLSGSWAFLSESSYAINYSGTPKDVYDRISPLLDSNDSLMVITLTRPYYGQHDKQVIDWLATAL